ncbi:hypothetical protein BGLA2_2340002 [Burkholderia gladioli]|nr:hypothetical protein BGLA2_2340002 [Burkholderia gladioli]
MQQLSRAADVAQLGDGRERYQLIRGHAEKISDFPIIDVTNHNFLYRYIQIRIGTIESHVETTPCPPPIPPCRMPPRPRCAASSTACCSSRCSPPRSPACPRCRPSPGSASRR